MTIDQAINAFMAPISDFASSIMFYAVPVAGAQLPLIVVWLVAGGLVFTLYLRFVNFRGFKQAVRIVRGDYLNPSHPGEVTHFQALSAALSGTVGLGNIAGVAVAISLGGPGAAFWMTVAGFLGMSLKLAECTLAVKYRRILPDGSVSGGPMYYIEHCFRQRGWPRFGRSVATFFCIACIPSAFSLFSANQSFRQFSNFTGFEHGWIFGIVVAAMTAAVIIGGIKSITRVTDKLTPMMCGIYIAAALVILALNYAAVPAAMWLILKTAFMPEAVAGGIIGAIIQGFRRATFSCEAGLGSSPIAHSTVRTNEPVTEGLVALLEPFIDTVIVCNMTALVIVVTGAYQLEGLSGIDIAATAFSSQISWFPGVFTTAVFLFAFSTIVTWSFYGLKAWTYLFGESKRAELIYKSAVCGAVVVGSAMDIANVLDLVDSVMFAMAIPNILVLYLMAPEIRADVESYLRRVRSGEIVPTRGVRTATKL